MAGFGRRMRAALLATQPGPLYYAALSVGDPGDAAATMNEPVIGTNGYARKPFLWNPSVATPIAGAPARLLSWDDLAWTSTGAWAASLTQPVSYVAVFSAAAGTAESLYIGSQPLTPPRLMDRAGIVITIPAGALELSIGLED
jgi:hypothetical protein